VEAVEVEGVEVEGAQPVSGTAVQKYEHYRWSSANERKINAAAEPLLRPVAVFTGHSCRLQVPDFH
jgi:hypothetical protein